MTKQSERLRQMLYDKELTFLMEAHSAISAIVVEEAGFQGIWASGLSISASLGLRDSNEASWTQVLDIVDFMADAVELPILLDGDTGYGDFNNARRLVKKLCQRGVAGVCLEDKMFPKTNSFVNKPQALASIEEFTGKIKASKDSQSDPHFSVVARIEALVAGFGMDEALRRAAAYADAGADAILIHSKQRTACEIETFMRAFDRDTPVVVVPTTYAQTPANELAALGVSTIIWANHNFRASLQAMQAACAAILKQNSVSLLEGSIVPMDEVFRITRDAELREAQAKYMWLPHVDAPRRASAAVVSAGRAECSAPAPRMMEEGDDG